MTSSAGKSDAGRDVARDRGPEIPPPIPNKLHLPYPKGPYGVSAVDILSYGLGKDGQMLRLLFPCDRKDVWSVHEEWPVWLPAEKYVEGFASYVNVWPSVLRVIIAVTSGTQFLPLFGKEPVAEKSPLDADGRKFPVVVFSHGLGTSRASYSIVCYELASRGFIVAALEHRDGSACMTPEAVKSEVEPLMPDNDYVNSERGDEDNDDDDADREENDGDAEGSARKIEEEEDVDGASDVSDDDDNSCAQFERPETSFEARSFLWDNPGLRWIPYARPGPTTTEQELRSAQLKRRVDECVQCYEFLGRLNAGQLREADFYCPRPASKQWDALRSLVGRVDLDRAMLAGHSMGGVTTMKALSKDNNFKCGVALDPWMYPLRAEADELFPKLGGKPLMCVTMEAFQTLPNQKILGKLLSLSRPEAYREIFTIRGSVHESPSDAPFMSAHSYLSRVISKYLIGPPSATDHRLVMDMNNALVLKFAAQFLKLPSTFKEAEKLLSDREELLRTGLILDVSSKS